MFLQNAVPFGFESRVNPRILFVALAFEMMDFAAPLQE
jgi:hypothetical protein